MATASPARCARGIALSAGAGKLGGLRCDEARCRVLDDLKDVVETASTP